MEHTISGGRIGGLNPRKAAAGAMFNKDTIFKMPDPLRHFPDLSLVKKEDLLMVVCIMYT